MQNLIKFGFIPLAGLALPLAATAGAPTADQGISYDYLEAGWVFGDKLDIEGDADEYDVSGTRFAGSAALTPNVFVHGQSTFLNADGFCCSDNDDVDFDTQSLGVGYHFPLLTGPNPLDIWGGASYERLGGSGDTSDGYGVSGGLRWIVIQGLEINASGGWRDYGTVNGFGDIFAADGDLDGWVYGVGAVYSVTPNLALTADWQRLDLKADPDGGASHFDVEVDTFSVGARWYFN